MVYGLRTCAPLALGIAISFVFSSLFFGRHRNVQVVSDCPEEKLKDESNYVFSSEHWKVEVKKPKVPSQNGPFQPPKVIRARFAATELGIREKLIVVVLSESSLGSVLNAYISPHVPKIHFFADSSRVSSAELKMPNLTPIRANGQHAHIHILNSIFNLTFHELYDFMLLIPDTTYVNPFELNRLVSSINWNSPQAIGFSDGEGKCILQGGILLSNPAARMLVNERHLCTSLTANSDQLAFEMCIHHATNLSCQHEIQASSYRWWRFDDGTESSSAVHDHVSSFKELEGFNHSITVTPLLSEVDARVLQSHFLQVEVDRIDAQMDEIENTIVEFSQETQQYTSWPIGLPEVLRPINRYQVSVWEYFTENTLFKIELNSNSQPLVGSDIIDVENVIREARKFVERSDDFNMQFVRLRNGYRIFNALRGMEYIADLEYKMPHSWTHDNYHGSLIVKRVHLCRAIHSTELLNSVPYVKEDTDITLVIGVESSDEVNAAKTLLLRHGKLCIASSSFIDNRQTRIVIAARLVDAASVRELSNDLDELKQRCKGWHTEIALLLVKPNNGLSIEITALDEAIDHFGQQTIYVLLSPYADYQREFLDRLRINTIRNYQVFFPIPFSEFNPIVKNAGTILNHGKDDEADSFRERNQQKSATFLQEDLKKRIHIVNSHLAEANSAKQQPLVVHKTNGLFDSDDFKAVSIYGIDYVTARSNALQNHNTNSVDLIALFLEKSKVHILRAIEPSLRVRYHQRECNTEEGFLSIEELARCHQSQRLTLGNKGQLASLIFPDLNEGREEENSANNNT
ncbi:chondroitin n-acetylgalactosaminyltransferase domain-containing protein [Ditylenchus destructor]|uniref:Hexosyltransferase n=1 Tax=Ditylenchus destructor TaxID=166010 RepID=A0AAD4NGS6_9BILA|nr:chondroitin n-acetylgalactosaminyltransferase domain-containing protein [Ditylenchus destructor]